MRAHVRITIAEREKDFEQMRQEILGALPKGPYEFSKDLTFNDYRPQADDVEIIKRFKHAVRRDARYGSANGFYVRLHGMSQVLRHAYDGGRQMTDGGAQ